MNAKQRKVAGKMRERAMLDADAKLAKIETELRNLAAERTAIEEARAGLAKDRQDLEDRVRGFHVEKEKRIKDYLEARKIEMAAMRDKFVDYEDGKILREVLLALDMDISPDDIAAKLRRDHQLLVPQW